jgi:small-conductance mechanosensitive channel
MTETDRRSAISILLGALVLLLSSTPASGQEAFPSQSVTPEATRPARIGEPATLAFWNRPITTFRSYYNEASPAERAARALERLKGLPEISPEWRVAATETASVEHSGVMVTVNDRVIFSILSGDLDPESRETIHGAAARATGQLRAALQARAQQRRWPVLLRGIGLSIASTLILLVGLWLVIRVGRRILSRLDRSVTARAAQLHLGEFDLQPLLSGVYRGSARMILWTAAAVLIYLWLTAVMLLFPYTQPWAYQLGAFFINLLGWLATGILRSIPGLLTVTLIFLLARVATRLVTGIFREVEKGGLDLPWLHRDTARATRYLVVALVWIFAITIAYPFIPGSNTAAFKGVSVFVGLVASLGSAGLVNQVMSGLVVVYSRALKAGEFVQIGDDMGVVTDVGLFSTKIRTRKREEITIPNSVLVGAKTVNFSRYGDAGANVGTTLTIGYDAPWRQVHTMLLTAASQTSGVRREPAPRVWQMALSDFSVEYELVVSLDKPENRVPVLSELHMHILDAFNEQGVQIMVPHFEGQPDERVVVPKSKWFAGTKETPAKPDDLSEPFPGELDG